VAVMKYSTLYLVIGDILHESAAGILPFECEEGCIEGNLNIFCLPKPSRRCDPGGRVDPGPAL
jgi:hypothetical protein